MLLTGAAVCIFQGAAIMEGVVEDVVPQPMPAGSFDLILSDLESFELYTPMAQPDDSPPNPGVKYSFAPDEGLTEAGHPRDPGSAENDHASASFLHVYIDGDPHIPAQPPPLTPMASSSALLASIGSYTGTYSSNLASTGSGTACRIGSTSAWEYALTYKEDEAPDDDDALSDDDLTRGLPLHSPSYIMRLSSVSKQNFSTPGMSNASAFEVAPPEALLQAPEPAAPPPQPRSRANKKRKTSTGEADQSSAGAEVPAKKATNPAKTAHARSATDKYLGGKANVLRAALQILIDKSQKNDDFACEMVKFLYKKNLPDLQGKEHEVSFLCFLDKVHSLSISVCVCASYYVYTCMTTYTSLYVNVFSLSRTCVRGTLHRAVCATCKIMCYVQNHVLRAK